MHLDVLLALAAIGLFAGVRLVRHVRANLAQDRKVIAHIDAKRTALEASLAQHEPDHDKAIAANRRAEMQEKAKRQVAAMRAKPLTPPAENVEPFQKSRRVR